MSFDVSRLVVPPAFTDASNDRNPLGSTRVRAELLRVACKDAYELSDMLAYSAANAGLDNRVDELLQSAQSTPGGGLDLQRRPVRPRSARRRRLLRRASPSCAPSSACAVTAACLDSGIHACTVLQTNVAVW